MLLKHCSAWLLRSISLIFLINGIIIIVKPELLSDYGLHNPKTWAKYIIPDDVNNAILGFMAAAHFAISIICGYSATFTNYNDTVKICRGLSVLFCYMLYVHIKDSLDGKSDLFVSMSRLYGAIAFHALFAIWSLTIAFSTDAAHQQHVQKAEKKTK